MLPRFLFEVGLLMEVAIFTSHIHSWLTLWLTATTGCAWAHP
jgi:hypothetical protein